MRLDPCRGRMATPADTKRDVDHQAVGQSHGSDNWVQNAILHVKLCLLASEVGH
jgi:hypothetical protein